MLRVFALASLFTISAQATDWSFVGKTISQMSACEKKAFNFSIQLVEAEENFQKVSALSGETITMTDTIEKQFRQIMTAITNSEINGELTQETAIQFPDTNFALLMFSTYAKHFGISSMTEQINEILSKYPVLAEDICLRDH